MLASDTHRTLLDLPHDVLRKICGIDKRVYIIMPLVCKRLALSRFDLNLEKSGKWLMWYQNSPQVLEVCYYKHGQRHGKNLLYHDNGKIFLERSYKNGVVEGSLETWWMSGEKHVEAYMANGKVHGPNKQYGTDGTLYTDANYKRGKLHGKFAKYDLQTGK
jgi:antitoxin component YwqK of YwqJK toxin-antitoxin module